MLKIKRINSCEFGSNGLREVFVAAHQSRKCYKQFPNNFKFNVLHLERLFTCGEPSKLLPVFSQLDVPAHSPKGQTMQYSERYIYKKIRATSQKLQASLSMLNGEVQDST